MAIVRIKAAVMIFIYDWLAMPYQIYEEKSKIKSFLIIIVSKSQ